VCPLHLLLPLIHAHTYMHSQGQSHAENDEDGKAIVCLEKAVEKDPYNLEVMGAPDAAHSTLCTACTTLARATHTHAHAHRRCVPCNVSCARPVLHGLCSLASFLGAPHVDIGLPMCIPVGHAGPCTVGSLLC
jgi:hypothetical protein